MSTHSFKKLGLNDHILKALDDQGYTEPTPIQQKAIPEILAGRDLLATAQTGTGKTAAFSLPMLHMLNAKKPGGKRRIRALILTPTRELALQVEESIATYGSHLDLGMAVLLGGVSSQPQIKALKKGPDILVATPGRLLDLIGQGFVHLDNVETLVLDEADRMLDMGFIHDVRRIVKKLPAERQTLFFSATLSTDIHAFAWDMQRDPIIVEVAPSATVSDNVEQRVLFVEQMHKSDLLADILRGDDIRRVLVFTRTKHRADRVGRQLERSGIPAGTIHSNKSQNNRQRVLAKFMRGRIRVLIGTDIVARGIDVDDISHVINYDMPNDAESYVHRIGRTARAGAAGIAMSFCDTAEVDMLRNIEKLTRTSLTVMEDQPFHSEPVAASREPKQAASPRSNRMRVRKITGMSRRALG